MWVMDISPKVFSKVKTEGTKNLKSKYPNIFFTTLNKVQTNPKFPTVYVHEVGTTEQGQDLENKEINAVLATFQIDVTDNENQNNANKVMGEVVRIMKTMGFSVVNMPEFQSVEDVYRLTARFRRMIGQGDIF